MSPDNRQHRGPHPEDHRLFSGDQIGALREATADLSWLLSHGYAAKAALKTVGDRYCLSERQRLCVARAACSDASREQRLARHVTTGNLKGQSVIIDGFNLIITVEAALGGGVLIECRDSCIRDLSSVHGSYRAVQETDRAVSIIGEALEELEVQSARWLLDKPVSNSGRLAERIRALADERGWHWVSEVVFNPDQAMRAASEVVVVTSDSTVLDCVARWTNINAYLLARHLCDVWTVDLSV